MNKNFRKALAARCKDMGLTDKAIDRLAELGGEGLADDASEEDITTKVDLLVPYAVAMQAEVTRKTRPTPQKPTSQQSNVEGNDDGTATQPTPQGENEPPAWAQKFQKQLDELTKERDELRAEKLRGERDKQIAEHAAKLGIPDYLARRLNIAQDADIEKELTALRQEMVSNNLMPKGAASETGTTEEAMKADAKAWAASLPNN